jgi:hypothetical protein
MLLKLTSVCLLCLIAVARGADVKASASVAAGTPAPAAGTPAPAKPAAATPAPTPAPTAAPGKKEKEQKEKTPKPSPTPKPTPTPKAPKTTAAPTAATTAPPKAGKYNCVVCTGKGNDCTGTTYDKNMDWCSKITGTVDDPKTVPSGFFSILALAGMGDIKTMMQQHKGEVVTVRKGAPPAVIALAGQNFNEEGCSNFPIFLGMKNATACLCKGDCTD